MANEERPSLLAISTAIRASMVRSNTGNKINTVDQGARMGGRIERYHWAVCGQSLLVKEAIDSGKSREYDQFTRRNRRMITQLKEEVSV